MSKFLVTGGAGFIGTNFVRHALGVREDWHIINLDVLTYAGNPANFDDLSPQHAKRHHFLQGDVRDGPFLEKLFSEKEIITIIESGKLEMGFLDKLKKLSKLTKHPKLLWKLRTLYKNTERARQLYREYPKDSAGFIFWRRKVQKFFRKV